MTRNFEELKLHFEQLADRQGCIFESDYHIACCDVADMGILGNINSWLVSSGIRLRLGVGQQYRQELMKRIKHPNVNDVKDFKERTHKNTDKEQESKREDLEEKRDASFHLNKIVDELKCDKTKDEFLPTWKKRTADVPAPSFAEMLGELVNYVKGKTWEIPNAWALIKYLSGIDDGQTLMEAYNKIYSGDFSVPDQGKQPPKGQFKEYLDLPDEEDDSKGKGGGQGGLVATAAVDPVETHLHRIAKNEYTSKIKKKVKFTTGPVYTVDVAETPAQKAAGLEVFKDLPDGRGLLFPFEKPDHVTFHMGRVAFPIDILFFLEDALGLKVAKIIHNATPGTMDLWSNANTACVLELPGGTCQRDNICVGGYCKISDRVEV
jgi:uncharacterized membrane protein (UPF0127 family)